ncbi:MAG: RNA-binding protein [Thaumarchaeota archaeon]|nr:MAG: RNA-binding protein [Thaumarchaeota archaeon 13_1_40CM_2_39_13_1]OLE43911.1 MAG: RNA-binding protein [Thaumarchaeota archaeon 13_1_20CM_2_39_11]TLX92466.1 MAG: RNA-binding protein [Nitrososphaerota archaeon]
MDVKRRYVIPGDIIATGPLRAEQNVYQDGDRIVATSVGISEIYENAVRVIPLTGTYVPKANDLVIGKVVGTSPLSWEFDINSPFIGFLPAQDVFGRDYSPTKDELRQRLDIGDLVAARVANFDRSRDPLLTVQDRDLGKIESGELVEISPSKVPRLIGKRGSMIQTIETATKAMITIGQNGWIVISCEDPEGLLKAIEAVKMVDTLAHTPNLTERVKSMLGVPQGEYNDTIND